MASAATPLADVPGSARRGESWAASRQVDATGGVWDPITESGRLPAWVGVGGTPQSVVRAGYGLPLVMAVIGGSSERFVPLAELYRRAPAEAGHPELPIAIHSPGHIAETDELVLAQHFPHHQAAFAKSAPSPDGRR